MNNKKSLLFLILAVLLIGLIVSSSTFAYFMWTSGTGDRSNVNVTIESGQVTMHIESENTVMTNLRPTADCKNAVAYGDTLATIVNNTGAMVIPSFKLTAKVIKNGPGELTSEDLAHIHYSVVLLETYSSTVVNSNKVLNDGSCSNPAQFSVSNSDLYFNGVTSGSATGTFDTVSTSGEWSDLPSASGTYLPRQFNTASVTPYGITFLGKPHTTSYQWFRVYVWIDDGYSGLTIGDVVSDPLQNARIELKWSENSKIEQVSSVSLGDDATEETREPGLYQSNGSFISWENLMNNGLISISSGKIIDFSDALSGELVIANTITSIEYEAFGESSISKVVIPISMTEISDGAFHRAFSLKNVVIPNTVTYIGADAFEHTGLQSVVIPDSVRSIGTYAFSDCPSLSDVVIGNSVISIGAYAFMGDSSLGNITLPSSLTKIEEAVFQYSGLTTIRIPDSVTEIGASAFEGSTVENVIFGEGSRLEIVGTYAFSLTEHLNNIVFGRTTITIEDCAFQGSAIRSISFIGFDIGAYAFDGSQLEEIYLYGSDWDWSIIRVDSEGNDKFMNASVHYEYLYEG